MFIFLRKDTHFSTSAMVKQGKKMVKPLLHPGIIPHASITPDYRHPLSLQRHHEESA